MDFELSDRLTRAIIAAGNILKKETVPAKPIYSPLPQALQESMERGEPCEQFIRLLKILPGSAPGVVECELEVVKFADAPPYEALSYVWGSPEPTDQIKCNGQWKTVTPNLGSALRHLRLADTTRLLWIDAICVNQDDSEERSAQVQLMRDIYSRTWRVVVWFGEDEGDQGEKALAIVKRAAEYCCQELELSLEEVFTWERYGGGRLKAEYVIDRHDLGFPEWTDSSWHAVQWLFANNWFERIWVVQEVAFAPAIILLGSQEMDLRYIAVGCWWLSMRGYSHKQGDFAVDRCMLVIIFFMTTLSRSSSFISILKATSYLKATDPRDKLFALLGLGEDNERESLEFRPDYSTDVVHVYTDFTRRLTRDRPISSLSTFYMDIPDPYNEDANPFPSWVIRWDLNPFQSIDDSIAPQKEWAACGKRSLEVETTTDASILSLMGLKVAPLHFVDHTLHQDGERKIEDLWTNVSNYIGDTEAYAQRTHQELDEDFVKTITAGSPKWREHIPLSLDAYFGITECQAGGAFPDGGLCDDCIHQLVVLPGNARKKSFFITANGQMGLGPKAARVGDWACIFFGHPMPYILRPVSDGKFQFLGPCYVHGMMEGEAVERLEAGKYKEEWLHLC